jgi:hypothetical protein
MNMLDKALQSITDHRKELVAVVVHLNDTYLIDDRPDRKLPGFARITATIERLWAHIKKQTGQDLLLVVHSGDFLGPSLVGKDDHGKAMVALLNKARVNYCVLGNHEFDYDAEELADRLREAKFEVLLANATDRTGLIKREDGFGADPHIDIRRGVVWPEQRVPPRVALTGVVSADVHKSFVTRDQNKRIPKNKREKVKWTFIPPNEAVIQGWNEIKDNEDVVSDTKVAFTTNIPFRILLTHGSQDEDRQLRRQIPETSRTYILGGHDHDIEYIEDAKEVLVLKNLANAETVRVMLLLAGGKSIFDEVYAAYARLQARQRKVLRYPQDLETVLLTASDLDRKALKERISKAKPLKGFRNLREALIEAESYRDIRTFVLRYDDHEVADEDADKIVKDAIRKVRRAGDDDPVCDFSGKTAKLEARDGHIRREPTNMGVFVAECVRLQAKGRQTDPGHDRVVAIINSGAFRCDSELKANLSVWDLRETFLYDDDDAIMVLKVPSNVVDALVKHGTQPAKRGTGAFPQLAGYREGETGTVCLAISSFLLTRSDNNDGYDAVLHEVWGPTLGSATVEETRAAALKASAAEPKFSIIEAVKEHAKAVEAQPPQEMFDKPAGQALKGTDEIVQLLQTYADTFFEQMTPDATTFANQENFQAWLGTDEPIAQWPEIQLARDNVRASLRQLPAVAACKPGAKNGIKALTAAEKELKDLQNSLVSHDFQFRYGTDYVWMFDLAARGIRGWFPPWSDAQMRAAGVL